MGRKLSRASAALDSNPDTCDIQAQPRSASPRPMPRQVAVTDQDPDPPELPGTGYGADRCRVHYWRLEGAPTPAQVGKCSTGIHVLDPDEPSWGTPASSLKDAAAKGAAASSKANTKLNADNHTCGCTAYRTQCPESEKT